MTYDEVKTELQTIRKTRKETELLLKMYFSVEQNKFDKLRNITDPSRDFLTRTRDTDNGIIEAIDKADRKRSEINERLSRLPKERPEVIDAIHSVRGLEGLTLFLYYLQGKEIKEIQKELGFSREYTWKLLRKGTEELWQRLQGIEAA